MNDFRVVICRRSNNVDLLPQIHRLRYRVFKNRLDWNVTTSVDMEIDNFDAYDPTFLAVVTDDRTVVGCARLLPTTAPYMLRDTFPELMHGQDAPCAEDLWESSRFAVDTELAGATLPTGLHMATATLLAGMLEWAMALGFSAVVTVTDVQMERILKRAGWPLHRYGDPIQIGGTKAVAGQVRIGQQELHDVRTRAGLTGPVLQDGPVPRTRAA